MSVNRPRFSAAPWASRWYCSCWPLRRLPTCSNASIGRTSTDGLPGTGGHGVSPLSSRRSIMTLFSAPNDLWSHRTRIVLAEKGIGIDIISAEPGRLPEDLLDLNPYHSLPTLVDRDLVLYDSRVIIEYLDERFPHPPLMPVDPILRAQFRLALYRIERDWYAVAQLIDEDHDKKHVAKNRKILRDAILQSADVF